MNTACEISGIRHRNASAIVALDNLEFLLPRRPFDCGIGARNDGVTKVLAIDHIRDRLRDIRLTSVLRTKLRFSVKIRTNTGGWQHWRTSCLLASSRFRLSPRWSKFRRRTASNF